MVEVKQIIEFFKKYQRYTALFIGLLMIYWLRGYPFWDSLFIGLNLSFLTFLGIRIFQKSENHKAEVLIAIFFGIIALQASWPIFMPRISLEDINSERGIIYADTNEQQMLRDAIIRVKPPLFPIFIFDFNNYPIANNLREFVPDNSNPNLQIIAMNDRKTIRILLNRVTGWSFDELVDKVKYRSNKPIRNVVIIGANISNIRETDNLHSTELYPYDFRDEFVRINNRNDFPVDIVNLTLWIEKNTSAWNSLKKWTDNGFCILPMYSEQWDYRSSGYVMNVNGQSGYISKNTFNASNIALQMFYVSLKPQEQKNPNIIFQETTCDTTLKDISTNIPYTIGGKITGKENMKYFTVLIKNVNTNQADSVWGYPNKTYQFDLANLPNGYAQGDIIQISVCRTAQDDNCFASKNITVNMSKGYDEVDFEI